jgi:hypothetical protein
MTMLRGAFSNALAPGFRKIVFETYRQRPLEGQQIVNMNTSKRAYEEDFPIAGFGPLLSKAEGASVTYQDALQGTIKRYTWTTFGGGFRITTELVDDDLYGIFGNKMSKALGRSVRNNSEVVMHSPYNNAFDTNFSGFVAGESLCSTAHALMRGGTISNRLDADFDLLSLQAAFEHFHALNDEGNLPTLFIPTKIVHSIGDYWMVNQVLKSQKLPGGNQNDVNQIANEGLTSFLDHYLIDPDSWFVLADEYDVNYFDRRAPVFSNSDDFHTGDALYKVLRRCGAGYSDWRGVWGSQGA